MYKKLNIGRWQFFAGAQRLQWVDGVSSFVDGGEEHILMWDFDEIPLTRVLNALVTVQHRYDLPRVYLLQSSPGNWIAYCFKRLPFRKALVIVADTEYVDWRFVQHSLVRGYFTLRISQKRGRPEPALHTVLPSGVEEDSAPDSLRGFVKYQTRAG